MGQRWTDKHTDTYERFGRGVFKGIVVADPLAIAAERRYNESVVRGEREDTAALAETVERHEQRYPTGINAAHKRGNGHAPIDPPQNDNNRRKAGR